MTPQETFTRIYETNQWEGGSGWGSNPEFNKPYVEFLNQFLTDYKIRSVLDIGCGDWQFSKLIDWTGIEYYGWDCVLSIQQENYAKYRKPNIRFAWRDVFTDHLAGADLVILKDVLQHWSNRQILEFLPRLNGYANVLITNCEAETNGDTEMGGFRPLNLNVKPFNLPASVVLRYGTKSVILWHPNRSK